MPLVSLANILHRAGLHNDALIVTNKALEISPKFVVIHFTMANIYVSKVKAHFTFYKYFIQSAIVKDPHITDIIALMGVFP